MRIDAATYEGRVLKLQTDDRREAMRLVYGFKAGEYELKKTGKRRSLDANAYAWLIIDKIAAALGIKKEEVYQNTIRDMGGVSETVCVPDKAIENLTRVWEHNGTGWQVETMPSKLPGCTTAILYYGSSVYDTKQMAAFIDRLIQDAKAMDIETLPPDKLGAMLEAWK